MCNIRELNESNNFSGNGIAGGQLEGSYGRPGRRGLRLLVHTPAGSLLGGKTHVSQSGLAQREAESLLRNQKQSQKPASCFARHILSKVSAMAEYNNKTNFSSMMVLLIVFSILLFKIQQRDIKG